MDTDVLGSMYANIVGGVAKEDSPYVTDEETSQMWDQIVANMAANPLPEGGIYDMVNEIP